MVCLGIIVVALKKPEALGFLGKVHKSFAGMTKAKALMIFISAFFIFAIIGSSLDKKSEQSESNSNKKESKTISNSLLK